MTVCFEWTFGQNDVFPLVLALRSSRARALAFTKQGWELTEECCCSNTVNPLLKWLLLAQICSYGWNAGFFFSSSFFSFLSSLWLNLLKDWHVVFFCTSFSYWIMKIAWCSFRRARCAFELLSRRNLLYNMLIYLMHICNNHWWFIISCISGCWCVMLIIKYSLYFRHTL